MPSAHSLTNLSTSLGDPTVGQQDFILLDASGSMAPQWASVLSSIDAYVRTLHALRTSTSLRLVSFTGVNGRLEMFIERDCLPTSWVSCRDIPLPGGMTPLYPAINEMGLEMERLNPRRAQILIATDGDHSRGYDCGTNLERARAVINWLKAKGYSVTFLGCDWNNLASAASLGVSAANAIGTSTARLSDVTRELAAKRHRYGLTGDPVSFSDDEKKAFGGYLSAPKT